MVERSDETLLAAPARLHFDHVGAQVGEQFPNPLTAYPTQLDNAETA